MKRLQVSEPQPLLWLFLVLLLLLAVAEVSPREEGMIFLKNPGIFLKKIEICLQVFAGFFFYVSLANESESTFSFP